MLLEPADLPLCRSDAVVLSPALALLSWAELPHSLTAHLRLHAIYQKLPSHQGMEGCLCTLTLAYRGMIAVVVRISVPRRVLLGQHLELQQ